MRDFLIESEIDLFKERLSEKMDISNFIKSCRITLRHIQEVLGMSNIENSNSNQSLELNRRRLSSKNSITIGKQQSHTKKSLCQDSFLMYLMSLKLFCKSLRIPQIAEHFLHGCNHKCRSYHINGKNLYVSRVPMYYIMKLKESKEFIYLFFVRFSLLTTLPWDWLHPETASSKYCSRWSPINVA